MSFKTYTVKVFDDGSKEYWFEGKRHRTDGPAIEWANGSKQYWFEGKLHRTDGPAAEYASGSKEYYFEGKFHRTDGPAIEYAGGTKYYYFKGKKVSESALKKLVAPEPDCSNKIVEIEGKRYKLVIIEE